LICGMLQLGYYPNDVKKEFNIIPVDFVSAVITHISWQEEQQGKIYHLVNPNQSLSFENFLQSIINCGFALQPIQFSVWYQLLKSKVHELREQEMIGQINSLLPLLPYFSGGDFPQESKYDCTNTLNALKNTELKCPTVNKEFMQMTVKFLIKQS